MFAKGNRMRTRATKAYKEQVSGLKVVDYHYVITIFAIVNGQLRWRTETGILQWSGDRNSAFNNRFEAACKAHGCTPTDTELRFWSFERNDL